MGLMGPKCMLGFSAHYTNAFSEHLERRSSEVEKHFREGNVDLMLGLNTLHDAVDAAIAGDRPRSHAVLDDGLARLRSCNEHLTALGEAVVRTRIELFERAGVDAGDPLIAREPYFARIDFDKLHGELCAHGAALPRRVYWEDLASRVRDGGARAGLRFLDRHLRELQSDLRSFVGEVEVLRTMSTEELGPTLHAMSIAAAAPVLGFARLLTAFTYFSIVCERASMMYERSGATLEEVADAV